MNILFRVLNWYNNEFFFEFKHQKGKFYNDKIFF